MQDSDDSEEPFLREPARTSWLPMLTAILIVVASISLAVWRLRYEPLIDPPPIREVLAGPAARPALATRRPVATKQPTPRPSAPPPAVPTPGTAHAAVRANMPLNTLASAASHTATAAPTSLALAPRPGARPRRVEPEPAELLSVAPRKVRRGSTTLLDVRGRSLRPSHLVLVVRSGRTPPGIAVPRQRFVSPTLLQVLVIVGADAPKGDYALRVAEDDGRRSNAVHFEVTP